MLKKNLSFLMLFVCLPFLIWANNEKITGATATSGVIYTTSKEGADISMNNAIVRFNGFYERLMPDYKTVPQCSYSALYALENTTVNFKSIEATLPVTFYFTEFDKDKRSRILNNLAVLMPELIDLKGDAAAIKAKLNAQFQNRLFIRKFFNERDLPELHMDIKIIQDDKEVKVDKVMLEFRMIRDNSGKEGEVLVMDMQLMYTLQFKPKQTAMVRMEYVLPSFETVSNVKYYFSPFVTGSGRGWQGNIKNLYIISPAIESTIALPYNLDYKLHNFKYNKNLLVFRNHKPEKFEKIGFYAIKEGFCDCGKDAFIDRISLPNALQNVTASSWVKSNQTENNVCSAPSTDLTVVKWVPDFDEGKNYELGFLKNNLKTENSGSTRLQSHIQNDCSGNIPTLNFKDRFNPIWAFDFGLDSIGTLGYMQEGKFNLETAWCTNGGVGEYLEFEITQPVDFMKFHTGFQKNDQTYKENNKVKYFELQQIGGSYKRTFLFSELLSSSYEVEMPKGKYRLYIKDIYKGTKGSMTCFSNIILSFTIDDPWLNQYYKLL